jgi:hypothetical protein
MKEIDFSRYQGLTFNDFKNLARDPSLSLYEKIGFPDSYRAEKEAFIFRDILSKLPGLMEKHRTVVDIGPGCSHLPLMLIDLCRNRHHGLILVDSKEMLDLLPDEAFITKTAGRFPTECRQLLDANAGKADVVLVYSVLHYIFEEGDLFGFVDDCLSLLAEGGMILLGDIPNLSKRTRFFGSATGRRFHREFMQTDDDPEIKGTAVSGHNIDDAVVVSLILRCRAAGYDAYILPQASDLPMANRREDILVSRP